MKWKEPPATGLEFSMSEHVPSFVQVLSAVGVLGTSPLAGTRILFST